MKPPDQLEETKHALRETNVLQVREVSDMVADYAVNLAEEAPTVMLWVQSRATRSGVSKMVDTIALCMDPTGRPVVLYGSQDAPVAPDWNEADSVNAAARVLRQSFPRIRCGASGVEFRLYVANHPTTFSSSTLEIDRTDIVYVETQYLEGVICTKRSSECPWQRYCPVALRPETFLPIVDHQICPFADTDDNHFADYDFRTSLRACLSKFERDAQRLFRPWPTPSLRA